MFLETFIENLRKAVIYYRRRANLTQSDLALRATVSSSFVSQFEQRRLKNMSLRSLLKITMVLACMNADLVKKPAGQIPPVSPDVLLGWLPPAGEMQPVEALPPYYLFNDFNKLK